MLKVEAVARLNGFVASQDFYCYPDQLREFAVRLSSFPESIQDDAVFEVGERGQRDYCWFKLRAQVIDGAGHCYFSVGLSNNLGTYEHRHSEFGVQCQAISLNQIGRRLEEWSRDPTEVLELELGSAQNDCGA